MSIFSHIRKSRQQAKEHKDKVAEQKKRETELAPYKHVPTHAATDAFASAPPSWRESYRSQIVEQNRRRSAMAASGHHMNMPGVPRVGSTLSRVSYPSEDISPMRMPKAYSYSGTSSYPASVRNSHDMAYTTVDTAYLHPGSHLGSFKGKDIPRSFDSQRISPASSRASDPSPVESSNDSTSSQDDLEIRRSNSKTRGSRAPSAHRLHPSHSRRTSDSSINLYSLYGNPKGPLSLSYTRDSRPPPSTRGFGSIPAIAAMPSVNMAALSGHLGPPCTGSQSAASLSLPSVSTATASQQSSSVPVPNLNKTATRHAASAPATPSANTTNMVEYPLSCTPRSALSKTGVSSPLEHGVRMAQISPKQYSNIESFSEEKNGSCSIIVAPEQDVIDAQTAKGELQPPFNNHQCINQSRISPPLAHEALVNVFPEQAGSPNTQTPDGKIRKLTKGSGTKLLKKKNRWSNSKVAAVTV